MTQGMLLIIIWNPSPGQNYTKKRVDANKKIILIGIDQKSTQH